MESEIVGEGQNEEKVQFERCKYKDANEKSKHAEGGDGKCKYMDTRGYCIFENCLYDQEETPPTVEYWWFECIVCKQPDIINPKNMKIHWCHSCIRRANEAEVLPFTCRYCGSQQNHPSQWMFSRVCDDCIDKLYWPHCDNYEKCKHCSC